jgi:dTDP-4-dehydrorhamnose reductase
MKVLVLGDRGMLGSAVVNYYKSHTVETIKHRWPSQEFKDSILSFDGDLIINCIGAIPQKTSEFDVNWQIPKFLHKYCSPYVKIINPSTDCVFEGTSPEPYEKNHPCDATSEYGRSKMFLPEKAKNFKTVRTSIIGYDSQNKGLLSWFLSVGDEEVTGYVNHLWNGITTHEWAKLSYKIYQDWDKFESLIQVGIEPMSKYELLCLVKKIYARPTTVIPTSTKKSINRCLVSDFYVPDIESQLLELKTIL